MLDEPLPPYRARKLMREILEGGELAYSKHALEEMAEDDLDPADCLNVLRAGLVDPGEYEKGSWRYRVWAPRITVVVAFRSMKGLVVVTAWRSRPRR